MLISQSWFVWCFCFVANGEKEAKGVCLQGGRKLLPQDAIITNHQEPLENSSLLVLAPDKSMGYFRKMFKRSCASWTRRVTGLI